MNISKIPNVIRTYGNSMLPILQNEDVIYLRKKKFQSILVNDILCVKKSRKFITHRVIYKGKNYVITKGDSVSLSDGKIFTKNIIGVVNKIKRDSNIIGIEDLYLIQSTFYFNEIVSIKRDFEKNGIELVFLKGLPLHLYFEKRIPRRIYADCDILLLRKDFPIVKKILEKHKYFEFDTSVWKNKINLEKRGEISFAKSIYGFPIIFDFHFDVIHLIDQLGDLDKLYSRKLVNSLTSEFFQNKRIIIVRNEKFNILKSEELFIFLLYHLFRHGLQGTHRYDFLMLILKKEKIDLDIAAVLIKNHELENFIFPAIINLRKYYGINFKKVFLNSLQPDKKALRYIKNNIDKINIFNEDSRFISGPRKFRNIFYLSNVSFINKLIVILSPKVSFAILKTVFKRLGY